MPLYGFDTALAFSHNVNMIILVIGATGKIGRLLVPKLIADGHAVRALVRSEARGRALAEAGAGLIVEDLEGSFGHAFDGIDAVVFTAGSGGSTGKDKTLTIDLWGAIKCIRLAEAKGADSFIMVSALKACDPDKGSEAIKPYLAAKHAADEILKSTSLNYTILRPGRLTDEPESGRIRAAGRLDDYDGSISRANVAECIRIALGHPGAEHKTIDLLDGEETIDDAFDRLESQSPDQP